MVAGLQAPLIGTLKAHEIEVVFPEKKACRAITGRARFRLHIARDARFQREIALHLPEHPWTIQVLAGVQVAKGSSRNPQLDEAQAFVGLFQARAPSGIDKSFGEDSGWNAAVGACRFCPRPFDEVNPVACDEKRAVVLDKLNLATLRGRQIRSPDLLFCLDVPDGYSA